MKLVTDNETLMRYVPHSIKPVAGEASLFDKIEVHIENAERWLEKNFTGSDLPDNVDSLNPKLVDALRQLVVAEALHRAVPSLDLVLTPNGFGVVNTSNLAPASKPRVDRLVGSMLAHRDDCIAALLPEIVWASKWLASDRADFFGATLFPDLGICDAVGGATGSRWEKYLELRSQDIDHEASLAEEWFSPELMSALRSENLRGDLTEKRSEIVRLVKAQVAGYLRSGSFNSRRLADIVNYIRLDPESFSEWHKSETAKLFAPPVLRNEKKASGYFF